MYKILKRRDLNLTVTMMTIEAPLVVRKALAGQFIILRVDEDGERIPLTIAGYDRDKGSVDIIFQVVGATTTALNAKKEGEYIQDFAGPLGKPSNLKGLKRVCVVGGGVGNAIAYPIVKALHAQGTDVTVIVGFRSKDLVILEEEFLAASNRLILCTDDGSYGVHGMVTAPLKELLESGERFDEVITIGPIVMMKFVALTTKPFDIPCTVSMSPIMVDGTGMCGGCRVTVGGETKFACVDGPDFDGYQVDFDEAIDRGSMYRDFENHRREEACRLYNMEV